MTPQYYRLTPDKEAVPCTAEECNEWIAVDRTMINTTIQVTTLFVGIDYDFNGEGKPLLFETMVFGHHAYYRRYSTWDEAKAGHLEKVNELTRSIKPCTSSTPSSTDTSR